MSEKFDYFNPTLSYDILNKTESVNNYVKYMLARTQSMFEYSGQPETLDIRMLELYLQSQGFCIIADVDGDLYALNAGLGGKPDAYYRPTKAIVANPYLKLTKEYVLNKDCVWFLSDSLLSGLMPMFYRYANMLVENDITMRTADINMRLVAILSASTDAQKTACDEYLKQVESGKLAVMLDKDYMSNINTQQFISSGSANYLSQLIEYQQYIKASWFNDLGLQSNYNMKRESINATEGQLDTDALLPLVDDMLKCRKTAVENINKMFGTNMTVDFASSWKDRQIDVNQQLDPNKNDTDDTNTDDKDTKNKEGVKDENIE